MADPTTIVATLQATLTGTTESIKAAELALENMQKNESFISNLLLIPK
jgi:hypothetical protein